MSNNNPFLGSVEVVAAPPSNVAQPAFLGTVEAETVTKSLYASNYGVKADGQWVYDAVSTNNSATITSASANFTAADVGKVVFGVNPSTGAATGPPQGTILSVTNPNTIVVSVVATANLTGVWLCWGTDDTAACAAAWTAALAANQYLILPSGFILVQTCLFNSPTTPVNNKNYGLSSDGFSTLCPTPNFDFTTAPSSTSGLFFQLDAGASSRTVPNYSSISNIGVYGGGQSLAAHSSLTNSVFNLAQCNANNLWVWFWGLSAQSMSAFTLNGPVVGYNLIAYECFGTGFNVTGLQEVILYSAYAGSQNHAVSIASGATLSSFGSQWGQQLTGASINIAGTFNSYGDQFLPGTSNGYCFFLSGSVARLHLHGAEITSTTTPWGIASQAGCAAFVSNTIWNLSAAGAQIVDVNTTGLIYVDDGTNTYLAGTPPGIAAANITPSTGWGTSGAAGNGVSAVAGDIRRFSFTITAAGTPSANPTVAIAFPWTHNRVPFFIVQQVGGTGAIEPVTISTAATTTGMTLTWNGTPAAGATYIITCLSQ